MRWTTIAAVLTGSAIMAVAGLPPAAAAAPAVDYSRAAACVAEASIGDAVAAVPAPVRCYATFRDAIAAATNGGVVLSSDAGTLQQADLDQARREGRLSSTVIGIEYEDANFGSGGLPPLVVSVGVSTGCLYHSFSYATMPGSWDNRVSSARTYESCKGRHYEYTSYNGASKLCGCATMGVMDAETSSRGCLGSRGS